MKVIITGVAGFIGSTLARQCLAAGWTVLGVDSLEPYYDVRQKHHNLTPLLRHDNFCWGGARRVETLAEYDLDGVSVVFHQAAQPGVRASWDEGFETYCDANVLTTQRLLELCRHASTPPRVVLASSSSVYGNAESYPVTEATSTRPFSPYGVTKLAAERLALAYSDNFGLEVVALRYFTVYGPAQRPDMAMHRVLRAALSGSEFPLYGTGDQIRDFTYVDDAVDANMLAATCALATPSAVLNVCGGSSVSLREVVGLVEELTGQPVVMVGKTDQPGDVTRTGGDNSSARRTLGWAPRTALRDGLRAEAEWMTAWLAVQ